MCGITGFISGNMNLVHLQSMTDALSRRGPDAEGIFSDEINGVGLGHRRLSIIDVSEGGNQPFYSQCGRYVMVYNGEVYNYQEIAGRYNLQTKTASDSEIILELFALKGSKFVNELNGMFALAIWDKEKEILHLYRDRIGIKPLYYFCDGSTFVFASELKAIAQIIDLKPNHEAIANFLYIGYSPGSSTFYKNVYKLPIGSHALYSKRKLQVKKYWSAQIQAEKPNIEYRDFDEAKKALEKLLVQSIQYRMISDVPLGTFLSGGIDSSIVTAIAQSISDKPVKTFSIGFEEQKFNEAAYAEKVAKHLGTEHYSFILSTKEALDRVESILDIYDEPFADSSTIPTLLVSESARKHVTVALSGDGGDELFLGYGMYQWAERLNNPYIKFFRKPIAKALSLTGKNRLKRAGLVFQYPNSEQTKSHIFSQEQGFFTAGEISNLMLRPEHAKLCINEDLALSNGNLTVQEKQSLFDIENYLCEDLLVKVDRASMFHSLEVRVPLLDHNIVNFALTLPQQWKVNNGIRKHILKEVLYQYVPKALFDRPKWGFSIPMVKWLKTDLRYLIEDYLSKENIERVGLVRFEEVEKIKTDYFKGVDFLYNRLWVLILLHRWFLKFK